MATAQPTMPNAGNDADADEAYGGADPGAQTGQDDGSYVIEIRVSANKDITVCVESGADEAAEEQGTGDGATGDADGGSYGAGASAGGAENDDENSQPVKSIKEALTLALEIFRNDGQMPQRADDDFQQGFDQGATK